MVVGAKPRAASEIVASVFRSRFKRSGKSETYKSPSVCFHGRAVSFNFGRNTHAARLPIASTANVIPASGGLVAPPYASVPIGPNNKSPNGGHHQGDSDCPNHLCRICTQVCPRP